MQLSRVSARLFCFQLQFSRYILPLSVSFCGETNDTFNICFGYLYLSNKMKIILILCRRGVVCYISCRHHFYYATLFLIRSPPKLTNNK